MHNSLHVSTWDPSETLPRLLHPVLILTEEHCKVTLTSWTRVRGLRGEQIRLHEMVSDQKAAGPSDSRFSKNPEIPAQAAQATCASVWNSDVPQACLPLAQGELQSIFAFIGTPVF